MYDSLDIEKFIKRGILFVKNIMFSDTIIATISYLNVTQYEVIANTATRINIGRCNTHCLRLTY